MSELIELKSAKPVKKVEKWKTNQYLERLKNAVHSKTEYKKKKIAENYDIATKIDKMRFELDTIGVARAGSEVRVYTNVAYESTRFIKIYADVMKHIKSFTPAGTKVMNILLYRVFKEANLTETELLWDYLDEDEKRGLSYSTLRRGIAELVEADFIHPALMTGLYFINPNFIFNGDRIKFVANIEKKQQGIDEIEKHIND